MRFILEKIDNSVNLDGRAVQSQFSIRNESPHPLSYHGLEEVRVQAFRGIADVRVGGMDLHLVDVWERTPRGVRLTREILVSGRSDSGQGVNVRFSIAIAQGTWKFFIPGACYDYCPVEDAKGHAIVSEERTSYPLVMAYNEGTGEAILLNRLVPAQMSAVADRKPGESEFLHSTEIGGIGFDRRQQSPSLAACIPYAELPSSRMHGRSLKPFMAFLPPHPTRRIVATYLIEGFSAEGFDKACFEAYARAYEHSRPEPVRSDRDPADCVRARITCLSGLVRNWNGHTGLALNFDPRVGRESAPSGYGTGFNTLKSEVFPRILEYGFTGRQLNNAFMLASWGKDDWLRAAAQIARSFLQACRTPSGFLHTLYDVVRNRAIAPFGDEIGSCLHYGVKDAPAGNYVRNMAEAGQDLCLLASVLRDPGVPAAASELGQFFLRTQNGDGSWYRAYSQSGLAITTPAEWFGASERANKSSTSTVIPFLVRLHGLTGDKAFLHAALRAGDWLLEEVIQSMNYGGGTLDNPNIVDKEGMAYPMMALLGLYDLTGERDYLSGAARAGGMALTWNHLWDVPFEEGTRLHSYSFKSRGWGGISILWGAGVVDNYSLWFLPGWLKLSAQTGEHVYRNVSELILHGTQQLLSLPGSLYGLCGEGMQEEGFACSHQGVDDGLIKKGDTWGALGWVFAAGTYCVREALRKDYHV